MNIRISAVSIILLSLLTYVGTCDADSPQWWKDNRAIYASFDLSGAGGPLMKFPSDDIKKKLGTFENLPILLDEAGKLGSNCIHLVSYWQPNYENKGDYEIRTDLGGPAAFKKGIDAIHAKGGRIILYLEAFIVTRTSKVGQKFGQQWCMKDQNHKPQTYYGRSRFYLMWPGSGSNWTEYICRTAENLVRQYGVDGFHLDSYGIQWNLKDHDPKHKGSFNDGAMKLVRTMRQRIQKINPNAVIILEGCEQTEMLDLCDGGQIESAAWQYSPVKVLNEKPWVAQRKYKAFTAHYSMVEMDKIFDMGYNFSLSPWWFETNTDQKDFQKMHEPMEDRDDWQKRIRILWNWDNLLYINGKPRPKDIDLFQLRRDLERQRYIKPKPKRYDTKAYRQAVSTYEPLIKKLLQSDIPIINQQQYLYQKLNENRIQHEITERKD